MSNQLELTIFSIDPSTNQPFIPIDDVYRLVKGHIGKTCKVLMSHHKNEFEDLVQIAIEKLLKASYDPKLSKPSTFIHMVTESAMGNYAKVSTSFSKWKEGLDFSVGESDDGPVMACSTGVEDVTPEAVLLAKETVSIVPQGLAPDGYPCGQSNIEFLLTSNGTKKCTKCRIVKQAKAYYVNKTYKDGLQTRCIPCMRAAGAKLRKKKLKATAWKRKAKAVLRKKLRIRKSKVCNTCKKRKPMAKFGKSKGSVDLKKGICCRCEYLKTKKKSN